jgi:acyl-CoA synthetase (AMP-forming)/AMP-acid ligase II/1-acyl-sn-glycerol-3-phosphate acyltransferase/acyl carrier protein
LKLVLLLLSCFFSALGLGYVKFFVLGYLSTEVYTAADKIWLIQAINSLLTVGPVLAYVFTAPLVSACKKRHVMTASALLTGTVLTLGHLSGWPGSAWLYVFLIGLIMSVFGAAKMSTVPIESKDSGRSPFFVNGMLSAVFIVGMLAGLPLGAYCYEWDFVNGIALGIGIFVLASVSAFGLVYKHERKIAFGKAYANLVEDSISIFVKYILYLISAPLIWGVAGAVSLAVTAYAEQRALGGATECSLMSLYAAIGIIAGNVLSPRFEAKRYSAAFVSGISLLVLVAGIPIFVEVGLHQVNDAHALYWPLAAYMIGIGFFFGICTNLIDAEYLKRVGEEGKEGTGASLHSFCIAGFAFLVGAIVGLSILRGWMDAISQFVLLAALVAIGVLPLFLLALKAGSLNRVLSFVISRLIGLLLSLRYRVKVVGLDRIPESKHGTLFLPNHPAEMDPIILGSRLWKSYRPRPVVLETFYHMPIAGGLMKIMNAFPMPDMATGTGVYKKQRIDQTLKGVSEALEAGDSVLMYPSGKLMRSNLELLGAASGVQRTLESTGTVQIVLVRTRGLWGSSFSTAQTDGRTPDLKQAFLHGFWVLLKNFIFFAPKRQVEIEFSLPVQPLKAEMSPLAINQQLEAFYNEHGEEELNLVSYSFWHQDLPEIQVRETEEAGDLSNIPDAQKDEIIQSFKKSFNLAGDLSPSDRLADDLGMDSLSIAELLIWLDEEFEVSDVEVTEVQSLADVILLASGINKQVKTEEVKLAEQWVDEKRPLPELPVGKSIQECFLRQCDRIGKYSAVADEMAGVVTGSQLKLRALLLAKVFREYENKRIGIMLPASVTANVTVMAVLLAGKVPVMLNWTVGRKSLEHARSVAELDVILTSSKFLDKVDNVEFGDVEECFVFLEQIMDDQINWGNKLIALLQSRKSADALLQRLDLNDLNEDDPVVILFTSGSESAPKGVPLSQKNILSNITGAVEVLNFHTRTALYGFLPPFHSFGFTITTVLPMVSGIKAAYHPNPTEGRRIARGCHYYGITLMCGTPTFINGVFRGSRDGQLDTLEHFVCGAEKLPDSVVNLVNGLPHAVILEGYGITECAPVITINRADEPRFGVGKPLPGVEIKIVDLDSHEELKTGERGLILVNGPNVFEHYMGVDKNPFVEFENERWYDTGDLGYLNEEGFLFLAGRLKRFVKIAGEMISLPAIESALTERWPADDSGAVLAVEAIESEDKRPELFLLSSVKIDLKEANEVLKEAGFSNLSKLKKLIELETMPLLGTGKTDYQTIKGIVREQSGE